MKFEESSLTSYLVKHLEPLTEADPTILSEYIVALLKKEKSVQELQKLCIDNLVEFLGHGTNSFVSELFKAFKDGKIMGSAETFDDMGKPDPSRLSPLVTTDPIQSKTSPAKVENPSTSSRAASGSEDKEVTDDEDDDRNHKHRRRDNRPQPLDEDTSEQSVTTSIRKKVRTFENGQLPVERGTHKKYSSSLERELPSNFDKRHPGLGSTSCNLVDLGPRTRVGRPFHPSNGPHFDLSMPVCRPPIGGRGRGTVPWNQHDPRFSPLDPLGFSPQMTSQVPSLLGAGLSGSASTQNTSWGAYGFIPGMPNGCLDPLIPLNIQSPLHPPINSLNVGMARQRCRDFEERGFCLRGDMCPMEHGINRIVVEDVQSLSQFNLSVSLPSTNISGSQSAPVSLPTVTSTALLSNRKSVSSKSTKSLTNVDDLGVSGILSASSAGTEADVYDPDQPLWNSDHPETSSACLRLLSPKNGGAPMWGAGASNNQSFGLTASMGNEQSGGVSVGNYGPQGTSSVWGRIGSGNKYVSARRIDNASRPMGFLGNKVDEEREDAGPSAHIDHPVTEEIGSKVSNLIDKDLGPRHGKPLQKAQRTLFVNGIPQKSNRRDSLLSHFKKFGEVIDIHIPLNSEKAFVQFSKREEAEAALRAPDAVMGNRFIKLWWANRDNIVDGESKVHVTHTPGRSMAAPVFLQPSISSGGGETQLSNVPRTSVASTIDGPGPATVSSKAAVAGGTKVAPPAKGKVESLDVLREELRKKQESLAQKRNDFKRQLDKLEKQAFGANKAELMDNRAVKKQKVDQDVEVIKVSASPTGANISVRKQPAKAPDRSSSGDSAISPGSKLGSTMLQQSPRNLKLTNYTPGMFVNRYKLDNRPTVFRIIPPLPDDLANITVLKEYFSGFGELTNVELEDINKESSTASSKPSPHWSAVITFSTRRSAEKAFSSARLLQGHSLQFAWVLPSSGSGHNVVEICTNLSKEVDAADQIKPLNFGISSSSSGILNKMMGPDGDDSEKIRREHVEKQNCSPEPLRPSTDVTVDVSCTSPVSLSCEEKSSALDVPSADNKINLGFTQ